MSSNKKIKAMLILEIIGKPPEKLTETLEDLIQKMNKEKNVKVTEKNISKPVNMKNSEKFFTSFAEVEVEVESMLNLALLVFKYMPSNIEVIEPESVILKNNDASEIFGEVARKLHSYDEVARVMKIQNSKLKKELESEKEKSKDR